LIAQYSSDDDEYFLSQLKLNRLEMYPYLLVMPAADRSLRSILSHEHIADNSSMTEQIQIIAKQTLRCVAHLHERDIVHGDLKPLNIMRCGSIMKLIDFDASVVTYQHLGIADLCIENSCIITGIGKNETDGQYCMGSKCSSAYIPPEMVRLRHDDQGNLRASCGENMLIPATPCFDVWSIGMILYELCAEETLFHADGQDNIDEEQLHVLCHWSDAFKQKRLNKIKNSVARNLISQLLSI
jgi:serine/threonine protein kinase